MECEEKTERRCVFEPLDCGGDPSVCAERFTCTSFGICAPGGGGGCVCPPCSCETCPAGEDCEPCDCPPCDCPAPEERSGLECWRAAELCIPEEIKCEANGDCPAGWVCAEPESEGRCIPEDWERLAKHAPEGGESQPTGGNEGGPTDNEGEGTPPAPTPGTPGAPVAGDPDGATGGSEAAPSGDAGGTGRLPTQGGSSGVGCATLPGPAGGSFALALLALLVVGVMRRRED